jgi:hypothetical protein
MDFFDTLLLLVEDSMTRPESTDIARATEIPSPNDPLRDRVFGGWRADLTPRA